MKFVRGFKTECERTAEALRAELAVDDDEPIDMHAAAALLAIPVRPLAEVLMFAGQNRADRLVDEIYRSVSAFTVFDGSHRTIVFNDEHAPARHRSNMAHEISHALLQHPPRDSGLSAQQEEIHEAEAAWLGGVLMLTAAQARRIAASGMSLAAALFKYRLSPEMLRFRLNVTGAAKLASATA